MLAWFRLERQRRKAEEQPAGLWGLSHSESLVPLSLERRRSRGKVRSNTEGDDVGSVS